MALTALVAIGPIAGQPCAMAKPLRDFAPLSKTMVCSDNQAGILKGRRGDLAFVPLARHRKLGKLKRQNFLILLRELRKVTKANRRCRKVAGIDSAIGVLSAIVNFSNTIKDGVPDTSYISQREGTCPSITVGDDAVSFDYDCGSGILFKSGSLTFVKTGVDSLNVLAMALDFIGLFTISGDVEIIGGKSLAGTYSLTSSLINAEYTQTGTLDFEAPDTFTYNGNISLKVGKNRYDFGGDSVLWRLGDCTFSGGVGTLTSNITPGLVRYSASSETLARGVLLATYSNFPNLPEITVSYDIANCL
jgi:hypothetical protein